MSTRTQREAGASVIDAVHFRFNADDNVASFSINYRLVAANIRQPKTGAVHVTLSVTKTDAPPVPGG